MSRLIFIGESHTWCLSGDPETNIFFDSNTHKDGKVPSYYLGKYKKDNMIFLWRNGTTAVRLDEKMLDLIIQDTNIFEDDILIFNFGTVDLNNKLIIDSAEEVAINYINICSSFAKKYNCKYLFIGPFSRTSRRKYHNFIEGLKYQSKKLNIKDPIIVIDHVIPGNFDYLDIYMHLTEKDSKKCLDFIIKTIKDEIVK